MRSSQFKIVLEGTGKQTRDFVYVSDVVEALVRCMNFNAGFHGPYLIASGQETSLNDLLSKLEGRFGGPNVDYQPAKRGDIPRMSYDISLAKKELRWEPKIMLEEGLKRTAEWWREVS